MTRQDKISKYKIRLNKIIQDKIRQDKLIRLARQGNYWFRHELRKCVELDYT